MKDYNSSKNIIISDDAKVAKTFFSRSLGLIPKKKLKKEECLIIKPCCSVHTFFMNFPIDVLFINNENKVIAAYENVKPWKILPIHLSSKKVLELPSGSIQTKSITLSDEILFEKLSTQSD